MQQSTRLAKEQFVSNITGTSLTPIVTVMALLPVTMLALWLPVQAHKARKPLSRPAAALSSLAGLPLPLLYFVTVLTSDDMYPGMAYETGLLFMAMLVMMACLWWAVSTGEQPHVHANRHSGGRVSPGPTKPKRALWLDHYRAGMMLMTAICILAVDFRVFPRNFGKTERTGYSLMDAGVGSFVMSSGVSAVVASGRSGADESATTVGAFVRRLAPALVLGAGRAIVVSALNYHNHVSEYGVSWNFFVTLGLVTGLLFPARRWTRERALTASIAVLAVHYVLLEFAGLRAYVVDPSGERESFIGGNREGIASLLGYASIYLAGLATGRAMIGGTSYMAVGAVLLSLSSVLHPTRKLADFGYVMYIVALNVAALSSLIFIDNTRHPRPHPLTRAISRNQLSVFLVANLMTGAVNLSMDTIGASNMTAMIVLTVYTVAVCGVALAIDAWRYPHDWTSRPAAAR